MSQVTHDRCRQSLIKTRQFQLRNFIDDVGRMLDHKGLRQAPVMRLCVLCAERSALQCRGCKMCNMSFLPSWRLQLKVLKLVCEEKEDVKLYLYSYCQYLLRERERERKREIGFWSLSLVLGFCLSLLREAVGLSAGFRR